MIEMHRAVSEIPPRLAPSTSVLFVGAIFTSASLLFLVQPMMAKLVLPSLGGSPAVWNTSLCFFQAMLLAGYAYAHGLQRFASPRRQALIHAFVLIAAALTLPLHLSDLLGTPNPTAPIAWLLGVLTLSIGLPFAALSATAPLLQAWFARTQAGANPYPLYAASNLGSLIALVAYPTLIEPLLRLQTQTQIWSLGFIVFGTAMLAVSFIAARAPAALQVVDAPPAIRIDWQQRATWLALAAAPSSLMLGVTAYISTDIASAPFLWIAPLALYLITFIIAFQARPLIRHRDGFLLLAPVLTLAVFIAPLPETAFLLQAGLHLIGFFMAALACHLALAARRPEPTRLTEFYLIVSLGGVLGSAFNALVAPVIFSTIAEYPLVLALICVTCALGDGPWTCKRAVTLGLGAAAAFFCLVQTRAFDFGMEAKLGLAGVIAAAITMRQRAAIFFALIIALAAISLVAGPRDKIVVAERSFFGVLRIRETELIRTLAHGTTLHGAQALAEDHRCEPLVYYARPTPIGQVIAALQARQPALSIGVVGMGAGSMAAYTRPGDRLRFYEIDPLVVRAATNPALFTYVSDCARGAVDTALGDARLSLTRETSARYDMLLVDAFSSDSIPIHLVTREAMALYLERLTPDGVVVMHVSNRHLELVEPIANAARAAGGHVLVQEHIARLPDSVLDSDEDAVIFARTPEALAEWRDDPRWKAPEPSGARVWSDDYVNIFGALMKALAQPPR